MTSNTPSEAANAQQLTSAIYEVSCFNQTFDLKGWLEISNIEPTNIELILKKRGTNFYYSIPYEWLDDTHWRAAFDMNDREITKGIWDFYFRYAEKNVRIKLEQDDVDSIQTLGKQGTESLKIGMYQTKKGALSIKSSAAFLPMDELKFSQEAASSWKVRLQGVISESLLENAENQDQMYMVVKNRYTKQETKFPVTMDNQNNRFAIFADVNYQDLLDEQEVTKQTWDCYLLVACNGDSHLVRLAWEGEDLSKEESGVQVEVDRTYNLYFSTTIYNKLSIRMTELSINSSVERISLFDQSLYINGDACLDAIDPDTNKQIERYVRVMRRGSQESVQVALPETPEPENRQNAFAVMIPLQQILELGCDGIEVYNLSVQLKYRDHIYEKKLSLEQFNYLKDSFLSETTMKHKGVTRFYITYTPKGNLKVEAYPLSTAAYFYLKYGSKLDRKLHQNKDIWLIGERFNTAQDTGYHFFKYCREHYPDLPIYYVINRHAKDAENVSDLGNVLYSGSLKHTRISAIATTFIGSHELDNILPVKGSDLHNYVNGKRVFLQHGVLGRKNVEYHKYYYQYPFHLFCVSSEAEKKLVQKEMHYQPDEVKVTGLSRFDRLLQSHEKKRNILFIPTWRAWLDTDQALTSSNYFRCYQSLLHNSELHQLLEDNELTLTFYPHYRMQPFISEFKKAASDHMEIVELGERNVQDLLMESRLMVTDYSSVSFDFNYMSKPVIFYHFDADRFFKNGILRPVEETFLGDICSTEEQVVAAIRHYVTNGFQEKETVKQKKHQVFSQIDQRNNERILQAIHHLS